MYEVSNWTFNEIDAEIAEDIQNFLPGNVFDIHAHIYRVVDLGEQSELYSNGPREATVEIWRENLGRIVGEKRLAGGLFVPPPPASSGYIDKANEFVIKQLEKIPEAKGLVLISPDWNQEKLTEYLRNKQIAGIKPFSTFSSFVPSWKAPLKAFMPEWAWKIADEYGLVILAHLVKDKALADPENYNEIINMCTKYPNAKLLLDHAARGFHSPNTVKGVSYIKRLENVWFDMSCICEPSAFLAILNEFGPEKLVWGSDFPLSQLRGKAVTVGDGFFWLESGNVNWDSFKEMCKPTLIGIESLRAIKEAFDIFGLNEKDIQDIFYNNALRLIGIKKESGTKTQELYKHAKTRIPGGTQLLSKRPENMAPEQWPPYFSKARGCEVWDIDGRHYFDMSTNGIGACLLGFANPEINRAVKRRINLGNMCTLNPPEEVELADLLCGIHPWAEHVRFARTGGEIGAVAVRIARAATGRTIIAVCGYHGWHDWYLAANLGESDVLKGHLLPGLDPLGVPGELRGTTVVFRYNNREEFMEVINKYGDRLAAVIMEPCRYQDPEDGFLEFVRDNTRKCGSLLIFDEITIGWRLCFGGSHLKHKVYPDMAIFAKALGNGYPIAAVIGTKEAMSGANTSFISSTYWTESTGPAAAVACIRQMEKTDVPFHVEKIGGMVKEYWLKYSKKYNLPLVCDEGYPCLGHFHFEHEHSEELRTLYTQLMLERGFLAGIVIYPTLAHTEEIICKYGQAIDEVFSEIATAFFAGDISKRLKGPVAHSGFRRLN